MPLEINILGTGVNDNIEAQVDPSFQALRANLRPLEYSVAGTIGGHFFMAVTFSNTAGQPNATSQPLFALRWTDSKMLFVLKRVTVSVGFTTVFTATQMIDYDIIKATSYSTNPSGGTAIVLATTAQKGRSANMSGSLLASAGAIQISSGSALTPGTQSLDTQPFGYVVALQSVGTPANTYSPAQYSSLYELRDFGQHPMIFAANEGFLIRNGVAYAATGVVKAGFMIEWAEVPQY